MRQGGDAPPRARLVVGNWKMCRSGERLSEIEAIADAAGQEGTQVVLCLPFPLIELAARRTQALRFGAQDCHHEEQGPHTGCTSAVMLRELGASHVIVGHSERRAAHRESDAMVRAKAAAAIRAGLVAVICVGETLEQRRAGDAARHVAQQVRDSLPAGLAGEAMLVAYEPVWAIGSGRTPTSAEVAEIHAAMRATLCELLGAGSGGAVRLLYGGSVNGANARSLLQTPEVDGVLVGSASLTARDFVPIVRAAGEVGRDCGQPVAA